MSEPTTTDKPLVFISYSHKDEEWVREWLLPRLEKAGLRTHIDFRDFEFGAPSIDNMAHAVGIADHTLLVLTPNWVASEWTNFEAIVVQTKDPINLHRRILPLMLEECTLPDRLAIFTYANFKHKDNWESELGRLVSQITDTSPKKRAAVATAIRASEAFGAGKVSLAKLPSTSPDVFGREEQFKDLDKAWADTRTNVLTLIAFGGVGKTALVNKWLAQMARDGYRGAERVLGWSFYSQGAATGKQASADLFVNEGLRWFNNRDTTKGSPWDKGQRLAGYVRQQRTLLILDGLEPLQHPPPAQEGVLKDPALQTMLRELAAHNPGLCLVTSRLPVTDIHKYKGATVEVIDLEKLSEQAGIQLLKHHGVHGSDGELSKAVRDFNGHALALNLLGRYLKTRYAGDIRRRGEIPPLTTEAKEGGHARRVMQCYERWFAGRFDLPLLRLLPWFRPKPELQVLRVLGLFDRPAEPGAIKALRKKPPIRRLTNQLCELPEERWQRALDTLRDARLLGKQDPNDPHTLDCHPLVREHFGEKLKDENPAVWKEAHMRLFEYYKALPEKEQPDTLEEMAPLYAAVSHGCQAGRYRESFRAYYNRILRGEDFYVTYILGAFSTELTCVLGFFDETEGAPAASLCDRAKAFVMKQRGYCLRAVGRIQESEIWTKKALHAYKRLHDYHGSAAAASILSHLYRFKGAFDEAQGFAQESVALIDKTDNTPLQALHLSNWAEVLHFKGDFPGAERLFNRADEMYDEKNPGRERYIALRIFRHCELLMTLGQYELAQEKADKALRLVGETRDLASRGLMYELQGRTRVARGRVSKQREFSEAMESLKAGLRFLRGAAYVHELPPALFALAQLHRASNEFEGAESFLEEALMISRRGEMRTLECDAYLEYARLYLARNEAEPAPEHLTKAREHYDKAKQLVKDTGYHRRDAELKALADKLA